VSLKGRFGGRKASQAMRITGGYLGALAAVVAAERSQGKGALARGGRR